MKSQQMLRLNEAELAPRTGAPAVLDWTTESKRVLVRLA